MPKEFKPQGYNSLSPYFIVEDSHKIIDMLEKVFDATTLRRFDTPEGKITHIEIKIDDSVIMVSTASETYPANQFLLHVYVPDVHQTIEKARAYGCDITSEPINRADDPDVRGSFTDFAGNEWAIGTQMGVGE